MPHGPESDPGGDHPPNHQRLLLPPPRRIAGIVNPAAGQERPVLSVLNDVFGTAGVDWEVFVTKRAGDARLHARRAVESGVDAVAVYGGDGTLMEAASSLVGTEVPLAIFPGGPANVLSVEMGIPSDLAEACALVSADARRLRTIDVGKVNGDRFLLRVGLGLEAATIEGADRELRARLGVLAYALSALQARREPVVARYYLTLDGAEVEVEGITCMIANAGSMGHVGRSLSPMSDVGDGLLDVVVIRRADLPSLLAIAASVATGAPAPEPLLHWQAREITVHAHPPQRAQADGEMIGFTPLRAVIVPAALRVIVPPAVA